MEYKPILCSSILKTITQTDSLFQGSYTVDPYLHCEFGCIYCDSTSATTIYIHHNCDTILTKELQTYPKGRIIIGSVHDPYQEAEKQYKQTQKILHVIKEHNWPCHILSKSSLITRDIGLLSSMDCLVTISMISHRDLISHQFEPYLPSPQDRLSLIETLLSHKIPTGIAMMPILPYITEVDIEPLIILASELHINHFVSQFLELKGDQKQQFFNLSLIHI